MKQAKVNNDLFRQRINELNIHKQYTEFRI